MDRRSRLLKNGNNKGGSHIVYWMSRDQRTEDNWALLHAQDAAIKESKSMSVVFCLYTDYPNAQKEHFDFMLAGLLECQEKLKRHNIPMHIIKGDPSEIIPYYLGLANASLLVSDFSPLKTNLDWKAEINKRIDISHVEVDTRNIVPCFVASNKKEYGAYTIRPKIHKLLDIYLKEIPKLRIHPIHFKPPEGFKTLRYYEPQATTLSVLNSGSWEAMKVFNDFIQHNLKNYHLRNDPNAGAESKLSKFLHFGQISSQRIALEVINSGIPDNGFLEELIIRRELADNFCYYEKNYDSVESFPDWAKITLEFHKNDPREYIYDISELESSATHDELWNAAQNQMRYTGYMNGYMRMYWAKKILEWSPSAEKALEACILMNDRYMMDGRDSNGYAGIAWSIGGVHDRAWKERAVFGKIRYMNYNGCKRKFDIEKYIRTYI
jgi:deoxyribodipyrimidine photo-lyase